MGAPVNGAPFLNREDIAKRILAGEVIFILGDKVIRVPQSWMAKHPAGALPILHYVGRDATDEVEAFHAGPTLKKM